MRRGGGRGEYEKYVQCRCCGADVPELQKQVCLRCCPPHDLSRCTLKMAAAHTGRTNRSLTHSLIHLLTHTYVTRLTGRLQRCSLTSARTQGAPRQVSDYRIAICSPTSCALSGGPDAGSALNARPITDHVNKIDTPVTVAVIHQGGPPQSHPHSKRDSLLTYSDNSLTHSPTHLPIYSPTYSRTDPLHSFHRHLLGHLLRAERLPRHGVRAERLTNHRPCQQNGHAGHRGRHPPGQSTTITHSLDTRLHDSLPNHSYIHSRTHRLTHPSTHPLTHIHAHTHSRTHCNYFIAICSATCSALSGVPEVGSSLNARPITDHVSKIDTPATVAVIHQGGPSVSPGPNPSCRGF